MNTLKTKPTELKKMPGYPIAETLIKQSVIFNCSLERAWELHIHRGVHRAHDKETIIELAELILQHEKPFETNRKKKATIQHSGGLQFTFNAMYKNSEVKISLKYKQEKTGYYTLLIYLNEELIYTHNEQMTYPFNKTAAIIKQTLGISRHSFKWKAYIDKKVSSDK